MGFVRAFLRRPRRVWLRRLCFQIHLWIGLLLTVYLIVIGFTGSILVFREELEHAAGLNPWSGIRADGPYADPATVIAGVREAFPAARVISLSAPTKSNPVYVAVLQSRGREIGRSRIALHPITGQVLGRMSRRVPPRWAWLGVVRNLHETLLLGVTGRQVNGVLAGLLLLINLTGMVVWWPGLRTWPRALTVDFRRAWRRLNFDLHRAVGFWTFVIVSFWAMSGVYFGWSGEARAFIDRISPLVSSRPPAIRAHPVSPTTPAPGLHAILAQAAALDPGSSLREIAFPAGQTAPLRISMQRAGMQGDEFADTLYFNPYDGSYLGIWKYGVNQSLGDWIVWSQIPLHFGTFWGIGFKILWSALGLAIPLLCLTGVVMYWNRYLRRHLSATAHASPAEPAPVRS
ncbi:MAG TPA: PepSY-associated TM helix domain-containing protein [Bryobacteraceae bacterium]